jgi:hypothetical protein
MLTQCVLQENDENDTQFKAITAKTLRLLHCQADGTGLQV